MMFLTLLLNPLKLFGDSQQFPFTKQIHVLVLIPGKGNPYHFFRLLLNDTFFNLLVNKTYKYADYEFLRLAVNPRNHISLWKPVC